MADKYKEGLTDQTPTVRCHFVSKDRVKANQSNIYGLVKSEPEDAYFQGANYICIAQVGHIINAPAQTTAADQRKT